MKSIVGSLRKQLRRERDRLAGELSQIENVLAAFDHSKAVRKARRLSAAAKARIGRGVRRAARLRKMAARAVRAK
jgi:hypothetical protein